MNKDRAQFRVLFGMTLFVLALLINCPDVLSQVVNESPPQYIPPSPNAYSLGKYGDVPVSLYTGVPDITIPIWTLQERELSVDVSLSYHGSGIKVDEIASWVGLGWSLNAGGVITRTIRGLPEHVISDGTLKPTRADFDFYSGDTDYNSREAYIQDQQLQAVETGGLDTEPDVYTFNFLGRSGKFVFNKDGEAVLYKHEALDVKLQYVTSHSYNIIITTEDGTIYEFADYETTNFPSPTGSRITSWYLSKIRSVRGSEIVFEYQALAATTHDIRAKASYFAEVLLSGPPSILPSVAPNIGMRATEIRIKKIVTTNGWVEFILSEDERLDYRTPSRTLESVDVYRADGYLHRRFILSTSYFEANNVEKYDGILPEDFDHLNYRLRLDELQEFSADDQPAKPPYEFKYWGDNDPTTDDDYTLPYRLSPSQDHWGYFNDAGNEHIFPGNSEGQYIPSEVWYMYATPWEEIPVNETLSNGADREPNEEAVKASSLKRVIYPTGGYTDYLFESHKWTSTDIGGGLRIQRILENTGTAPAQETYFVYDDRKQEFHPRELYYKFFEIVYDNAQNRVIPTPSSLESVGIPQPYPTQDVTMIKVTTYPMAVLGNSFQGYSAVTVYQPGNGITTTTFDTHAEFEDYHWTEDLLDPMDATFINDLFLSQHVNLSTAPGGPYLIFLSTGINDWPYPEPYDNSWKRGVITSRLTYSENYTPLRKETYQYRRQLLDVIPGFKFASWDNNTEFFFTKYYIPHAWMSLEKYMVEQYDENGANPVTTTTEYYHDNLVHTQRTRSVTTDSEGKKLVTVTNYPGDYSVGTPFIDDMKASNLHSYPIEQVNYEDDNGAKTILSGSLIHYKAGGKGLKDQVSSLEIERPISSSSFKFSNRETGTLPPDGTATAFAPDARYQQQVTFDLYDNSGNALQYTSVSAGFPKSYVWGYDGQFPIAEITNGSTVTGGISSTPFDGESMAMFLTSAEVDHTRSVTIAVDLPPSAVNGAYDEIVVQIDVTKGTEHIATLTFNFTPVSSHDEETLQLSAGNYSLNYLGKADAGDPDYSFSGTITYVNTRSTVFHTSFEEDTENTSPDAKTGAQSRAGTYSLLMPPVAGEYVISYWHRPPGGEWTYHQTEKTVIANEPDLILGEPGHLIDEVRMHPRGAQMTTYTYDRLNGMTSMTDPNSVTVSYEYDASGRLIAVKDQENNVVKKYTYHYKEN